LALDPQALVTVEEARTYLGAEGAELPSTGTLEQIISGLSLRAAQRTGRTYINSDKDDKATQRQYSFDPTDRILAIDDVRELGAVEITATADDEDSWEDVDAGDIVAEPVGHAVPQPSTAALQRARLGHPLRTRPQWRRRLCLDSLAAADAR
jgi:hypothetical protein